MLNMLRIANNLDWYVHPYTSNIEQPALLSKQISSGSPTKFRYMERCFYDRCK